MLPCTLIIRYIHQRVYHHYRPGIARAGDYFHRKNSRSRLLGVVVGVIVDDDATRDKHHNSYRYEKFDEGEPIRELFAP